MEEREDGKIRDQERTLEDIRFLEDDWQRMLHYKPTSLPLQNKILGWMDDDFVNTRPEMFNDNLIGFYLGARLMHQSYLDWAVDKALPAIEDSTGGSFKTAELGYEIADWRIHRIFLDLAGSGEFHFLTDLAHILKEFAPKEAA